MSLKEQVEADMKTALKNREKVKLGALRSIKNELLLLQTSGTHDEITEEDEIQVLKKMAKQRRESAEIYQEQNKTEAAQEELQELEVIESYLPAQMDEETLKQELQKIIEETGASGMKDMGKVMGAATKKFAGKADNKLVADMVKKLLSS